MATVKDVLHDLADRCYPSTAERAEAHAKIDSIREAKTTEAKSVGAAKPRTRKSAK